ncbi:MAG: methylisocitrate lyase [Gemmatimonadetes bacterium]|nr:methylisocitrate lyase [Gemmatimonadota bacterium]|tara:strand:- start:1772 stop:2662 length:891 start_codon:yes stop_codon:yes gene_type:complete
MSAGQLLRDAMEAERPLQIVGTINAYTALLAQDGGYRAIYLSGAGVANASYGLPDLALTSLNDVVEDVRRIAGTTEVPLLVDADTGWGPALMIARTVRELTRAGAAGCHIEDQVQMKRCGHRPGKALVSGDEMADRIKSAVDGRVDDRFMVVARTDALASEGLEAAIERSCRYVEAGADVIFAEAVTELEEYSRFVEGVGAPILANITEFGKTPLFTMAELASVGVRCALYPLSAFRAMSKAALAVYQTIRAKGTQAGLLGTMQTRAELYETLRYEVFERKIDELFEEDQKGEGAS